MPDQVLRMVGGNEMASALRNLVARTPKVLAAAIHAEGEIEMTEAKRRTPVDTGALRASGFVEDVVVSPTTTRVQLGFGGPSAPYAVYVHEDLEALHPVGQAKFLESTLLESAPHMADRIARRVALSSK